MKTNQTIYWRLSGFYFFYFASVGTIFPYWGLFLQNNGYSAQEIANVFAVILGTKLIAPYLWGWVADKFGKRMQIIRITSFIALIAFAGVLYSLDYGWMLLVMVCFGFFWNAMLPQFEAVTLQHLDEDTHRYSSIRLWGSLGFVLLVALLGSLLEMYDVSILPLIILALLAAIWLSSFFVTDKVLEKNNSNKISIKPILLQPPVILFFLICLLLQASHGPYYAFYTIHLENFGYSRTIIGELWAVGVLAEIIIFMFMHRLLPRWGAGVLLAFALFITAFRWWLIGHYANSLTVIFIAQLMHAASFGIYHASAIHLVQTFFPGSLMGRGQALYSSLSFGAGGAIGVIYSGYTWQNFGAAISFDVAASVSLAAFFVCLLFIWVNRRKSEYSNG